MKDKGQMRGVGEGEKQPELLSEKKAASLLYLSFKFSQGSHRLQTMIFESLHQQYPHYRLPMGQSELEKIYLAAGAPAEKLILNKTDLHSQVAFASKLGGKMVPIDEATLSVTMWKQLQKMAEIFNDETLEPMGKDEVSAVLFRGIVGEDHYFLVEKGGRPKKKDRFQSQFCDYCIHGKKTGEPEYDEMFAQVKKFSEEKMQGEIDEKTFGTTIEKLKLLLPVYNVHYPDQAVQLDWLE